MGVNPGYVHAQIPEHTNVTTCTGLCSVYYVKSILQRKAATYVASTFPINSISVVVVNPTKTKVNYMDLNMLRARSDGV